MYGHFFQDLSPEIKKMVMERYVMNKNLIQKEGTRVIKSEKKGGKVDTFQPKTTMSMLRKKIEATVAQSGTVRHCTIVY